MLVAGEIPGWPRDTMTEVYLAVPLFFWGPDVEERPAGGSMSARARLDALLELQAVDMEIARMMDRSEVIPHRRAEVARDITLLEVEKRDREEALERGRLDRRARESELETEQQRRERYEHQLNEVKTNVAYSALLTEIQGARKRIAEMEDAILSLMAEREEHEGRIAELETDLTAMRQAAAGELDALDGEAAELDAQLARERASREALASTVDDRFYRMYDRLRRGRRFPALVPLRGQACGACHGRLPPQVVREITHHGTLHACESCGVLIYAGSSPEEASATGLPVSGGQHTKGS